MVAASAVIRRSDRLTGLFDCAQHSSSSEASVLLLVHATAAQFCLGGISEGAIALGVDERVHGVFEESSQRTRVPAPPSFMGGHPAIGGEASQQAEAALAVGRLFWIG